MEPKPFFSISGYYCYPECIGEKIYFIEFNDPNPKGKSRTETVMNKKLPIKHKILMINLHEFEKGIIEVYTIKEEG